MKLSQLLSCLPTFKPGPALPPEADGDVQTLTVDSREASEGSVFIAIRGSKSDGHQFLPTVCAQGTLAVVVEDVGAVPPWYWGTVVHVQNSRKALDRLACFFYGEPSQKLFCVGVTGTNGKTTTTHIIEHLLNSASRTTGVIGTIDHHLMGRVWPSQLTTPDPISLQKRLHEFVEAGAHALSMEVSSHALKQARADSIEFDTVVFTNLTRDHLDYHPTMEDYFQSKARLFGEVLERSRKPAKTAILNADDPAQARVQVAKSARVWRYGFATGCDFHIEPLRETFAGSEFRLTTPVGVVQIELPMPGRFNLSNAAAACAVAISAGVTLTECQIALQTFRGVPGRLEGVANTRGISVFVDYAHTDDALKNVLQTLQSIRTEMALSARLITVFGCGGDRDPGKRPLMAKAACQHSDVVIVTSDNPRTEDPDKIIDECLHGVTLHGLGQTLFRQVDRRQAIAQALAIAQKGDVVLIAGKGHEDYQILGTHKVHFSDVEVVQEILK